MTDGDFQPIDKGSCLQDDSSYDEKQRMLESLGKFKPIETVVQVKSRSYRLHDDKNESFDHASNDEDNSIANDDKKVKCRTSSSSKETQDSGVKSDRSRTERTSSKSSASRSSKDQHIGHGSSSHKSSLVSKDSGCKSSSSHSNQDRCESSKSSRYDDKRTKDCSSTNEKSVRRPDGSDRSKRDCEKSDLDAKKERNEDLRRFEKEQTELQKRIEDLKKEIFQEKSKIKEIEGRVDDAKVSKLVEDCRYSSSKVNRIESSQVSEKSRVHKPYSDSSSHSQKLERHHQSRSSDSKDASDSRRHSKDQSESQRSHSRSLKIENSIQGYRCRSPNESEEYNNRRVRAVDEHRRLNLRNSNNYRSSSRESGKGRNSDLCRQRSRSPCDERRRSITMYSDKWKQDSRSSSLRNCLLSVRNHLDRQSSLLSLVKTKNESSDQHVRNYKDIRSEECRNKLSNYLKNIKPHRVITRMPQSQSTSDLYHGKSSDGYGSPISVESFDLDWPRSPHQPGVDLRANDDCISPISQFHASGDARIFKEEFGGKIVDNRLRSNSTFHSFLGQHLLAKRYDQRNGAADIWTGRNIDCFELIQCIGKGSFGQIFKAADKDKNLMVAVKKITADAKLGFPVSALRELKCLNLLKHPNIICLLEVAREVCEKGAPEILGMYYYVYEYVAHDLKGIIESNLVKLSPDNIACLMMQLLSALEYCHSNDLIHCNVKSSSILVSYRGQVKLTHFGLSRSLKNAKQGNQVKQSKDALLWYQAPEILLGSEVCEPSVDIWSSGCILGEMFQQKPLFASRDDLHQLCLISSLCGSPNALVWPDVTQLPRYYIIKSREQHPRRLREEFYFLPNAALDVLDALLAINPQKRCTAAKALQMDWLRDVNLQRMPPIILPKTTDCHSMLNESKSETTSEAASQGVKRNFSPVSKGLEDEMEVKRRKKIDPAIVRLALSNLSSAIDALHQHQIQKESPSSHTIKSTLDSSSVNQTSREQLPSTKGSTLQLRFKDYQHQTISSELSSDSNSHMPCANEENLVRERSSRASNYLQQKQKSSESRQSSEFVQKSTDDLKQNFSLPGSEYESCDYISGNTVLLSTRNEGYPKSQMSVETIESERNKTLTTTNSQLTSESPVPALSESSIAFWDAMKAYCANLGTVTSEAAFKSSESKKTLPNVLNPVHKARSLYPADSSAEEFSRINSGRDARAAEPGKVSYCGDSYDSSYLPGTLQSYYDVNTEVTALTPQMHSDNANYSASYSTFSDDPRLRSFRMRMGTGYSCDDMPTDSGNIDSMTKNSDGNASTSRVASSSRVRVVPRRVDVDKRIMQKSASTSLQSGQNSDLTNALFDQTSESCNPYPSATVESSLPSRESETQTNLRPKLTGILKKRSETQPTWK